MTPRPLTEDDVEKAAGILTTAFEHDPIFTYIFRDRDHYRKTAPWLFGTWVRWTVRYGTGWISEDGEAVILMRSLAHPGMSLWTMIRAGMLPTPRKLGWKAFRRFYFGVVALLDRKHAAVMGRRPHWYGWMVGARESGKGMGRPLLAHCLSVADGAGLPIFLETATPANLGLYGAKGFAVADSASISPDCTIHFMVREPRALSAQP